MRNISIFVLTIFIPSLLCIAQTVDTLFSSKDNTLYEDNTGSLSNGAGERFFAGRNNQSSNSIRRGLLAFDLSAIPSGATINSVGLTLNMSRTSSTNDQTINLHRLSADWGEGSSDASANEGAGAAATTGDATWLHTFFNTSNWASAGGDFSNIVSASQSIGATGVYTWASAAEMVTDVQDWVNNPSTNFGWILIGNETTGQTAKRFDTKENSNSAVRPRLIVDYTSNPPIFVAESSSGPDAFELKQNFPNPFNPTTTIRYQLIEEGIVNLTIYSPTGEKISVLVDGFQARGTYAVPFDASALASGVYIYTLRAGGRQKSRKLVLMK